MGHLWLGWAGQGFSVGWLCLTRFSTDLQWWAGASGWLGSDWVCLCCGTDVQWWASACGWLGSDWVCLCCGNGCCTEYCSGRNFWVRPVFVLRCGCVTRPWRGCLCTFKLTAPELNLFCSSLSTPAAQEAHRKYKDASPSVKSLMQKIWILARAEGLSGKALWKNLMGCNGHALDRVT